MVIKFHVKRFAVLQFVYSVNIQPVLSISRFHPWECLQIPIGGGECQVFKKVYQNPIVIQSTDCKERKKTNTENTLLWKYSSPFANVCCAVTCAVYRVRTCAVNCTDDSVLLA